MDIYACDKKSSLMWHVYTIDIDTHVMPSDVCSMAMPYLDSCLIVRQSEMDCCITIISSSQYL